jgi:predicted transcriptional regulator
MTTRERIAAHVAREPGVHFNELVRALDLAPGQTQYHLDRLDLTADEWFGRTHYYPPGYNEWERAALALLRRETAADIVSVLLADGPLPAGELAARVGIARSTLSWHRERLERVGLVKTRPDRGRTLLWVPEPERTARLVDRADPSLPERLVDRFTRLVDALLEE